MTLVIERKPKRKLATSGRPAVRSIIPLRAATEAPRASFPVCANIHCADPLSGRVVFDARADDCQCAICGEWQKDLPAGDLEEMA